MLRIINKTEKTVSKGCADKTKILIEHDKTATKCIDWTRLDKTGRVQTTLDETGRDWTRLDKIGQD